MMIYLLFLHHFVFLSELLYKIEHNLSLLNDFKFLFHSFYLISSLSRLLLFAF